jgi:hypothetical protein
MSICSQQWDKNYQQHQSFAGMNEWRLDLEKRKNPRGGARFFSDHGAPAG